MTCDEFRALSNDIINGTRRECTRAETSAARNHTRKCHDCEQWNTEWCRKTYDNMTPKQQLKVKALYVEYAWELLFTDDPEAP